MKTFDKFWADLLKVLDTRRKIRNWTAYNSHAAGGTFFARSVRSLDKKTRTYVLQNVFVSFPENLIVCTQVRGKRLTFVGRKSFADRYGRWPTYRDNRMSRQAFGGGSQATPYVISIFKEFDALTR